MAVYFELFGLPGSGKTTLCRPVISIFKEKGYKVADLESIYYRKCRNRKKFPVLIKMALKINMYPLYFKLWKVFLTCNSSDRTFSFFMKAIFLSYQILDAIKDGEYDMIICEEGIIQYISSFSYLENIPDSKFLYTFCVYISSLLTVYPIHCCSSIEESILRIGGRPVVSRRFSSSSCPMDVLRKALDSKKCNLDLISSHFQNTYSLDMMKEVSENQKKLYSYIVERLNQSNKANYDEK